MPDSKAGGYISQVQFKHGESIELLQNHIVVFVGPNNAGKTQCLTDIQASADGRTDAVVV